MGEIKQTNFRVDQETADEFRAFCVDHGMNQAQGFAHIMQVVELNRAKAAAPGRATEIEHFEKLVKDLLAVYLNSVELANTAEVRAKENFSLDLDQKDRQIHELQRKLDDMKRENKSVYAVWKENEKEKVAAEEKQKAAEAAAESAKQMAADQKQINAMLAAQLEEEKEKRKETESVLSRLKEEYKEKEKETQDKIQGYEDHLRALSSSVSDYQKKIEQAEQALESQKKEAASRLEQAKAQTEFAIEKAVLAKEKEMQEKIHREEIENAKLAAVNEELRKRLEEKEKEEKKQERKRMRKTEGRAADDENVTG